MVNPVVGIVIVSHSYRLAEGVKELADSLMGGRVPIATAGGLDEVTLGTSAEKIMNAIRSVWSDDGVLVLIDMGSAVLNTKLALELLPDGISQKIFVSNAPLVEGTLMAALKVDAGGDLSQVIEDIARANHFPKSEEDSISTPIKEEAVKNGRAERVVTIVNRDGIHARSAAKLVQLVKSCGANVFISKIGASRAPVRANSLFNLLSLGGKQGDQLLISIVGERGQDALDLICELFQSGFN